MARSLYSDTNANQIWHQGSEMILFRTLTVISALCAGSLIAAPSPAQESTDPVAILDRIAKTGDLSVSSADQTRQKESRRVLEVTATGCFLVFKTEKRSDGFVALVADLGAGSSVTREEARDAVHFVNASGTPTSIMIQSRTNSDEIWKAVGAAQIGCQAPPPTIF